MYILDKKIWKSHSRLDLVLVSLTTNQQTEPKWIHKRKHLLLYKSRYLVLKMSQMLYVVTLLQQGDIIRTISLMVFHERMS